MRAVAVVEGAKAALVLLLGFGLLALIGKDVEEIAVRVLRFFHLDPTSKFPSIFVKAAEKVTDTHLWLFAGFAALYSIVRAIEAYGLWNERRWAEWFALISTAFYIPFEVYEIFHHFRWYKVAILGTNIAIVIYMAYALKHSAEQDLEQGKIAPARDAAS